MIMAAQKSLARNSRGKFRADFIKPIYIGCFEFVRSFPGVLLYGLCMYNFSNHNARFSPGHINKYHSEWFDLTTREYGLVVLSLLEDSITLALSLILLGAAVVNNSNLCFIWIMLKNLSIALAFTKLGFCFFRPLFAPTLTALIITLISIFFHCYSQLVMAEFLDKLENAKKAQNKTRVDIKSGTKTQFTNSSGRCAGFVHVHPSYAQVVANGITPKAV